MICVCYKIVYQMEVFNKFKSSFSSSVSNTVFNTVNAVSSVLPGNAVTREYEVIEQIGSAGPGLIWKVYSGTKKSTKEKAAIFVLEKRLLDRYDRSDREQLIDIYRRSVSQLTRLRHPQVLTVQHPLEESRDCLAFATEPVFASLANVLGRTENLPHPLPVDLRDYKLFDVEIKYGLLQLCEGIFFLHNDVKMLHRNICPESIVINNQGAWKIFGFDFCLANCSSGPSELPTWNFPQHMGVIEGGHPDLDFLAPEYSLGESCSPASDMFSLGMLIFALYNSKPLFCNSGSFSSFKRNSSALKTLRDANFQLIPANLRESLKLLLNILPQMRQDATQLSHLAYFDDIGVKTLNNLDSQFQWDNLEKSQFYKSLPQVVPILPHRVALHRVIPCLAREFVNAPMIPFVLPTVLAITEAASNSDYVQYILPDLKNIMKITEPIQVLLVFMQKMDMLLAKTPPVDVKSDVLPMVYRALESDTSQIIELCLSIIPGFAGLLDYQAMRNSLLPRIKKLSTSSNVVLSVRVNSLICIGKLLPHLDKWLVLDDILPSMANIPSREPAVIMAITGIYRMTLNESKLGMTKDMMANKALPFLFPLCIENGLNVGQFNVIISLIKDLIARVETEQLSKLEQLGSIQSKQRSNLKISMSEEASAKPDQLLVDSFGGSKVKTPSYSGMFEEQLGLKSFVSPKNNTVTLATTINGSRGETEPQRSLLDSEFKVGVPQVAKKIITSWQQNDHLTSDMTSLDSLIGLKQKVLPPSMTTMSPNGNINSTGSIKALSPSDIDEFLS